MKRIISIILSVAMLMTLLSITASAVATTSVSIAFDPRVGAEIPLSVSVTLNQDTPGYCSIEYMFTGDAVTKFTPTEIASRKDIDDFCNDYPSLGYGAVYEPHEYLFVFSVEVSEGTVNTPTITSTDKTMEAKHLFRDVDTFYFYTIFTPKAPESSNDTNTNVGSSNSGTTNGYPAILNGKDSQNIDVNAIYKSTGDETTVYSVVIEWGSMEFTYNSEFVGTWNPETHDYDEHKDAYWTYELGANAITVTNHSNTAIGANFTYASYSAYDEVTGSFFEGGSEIDTALSIETAVDTNPSNPPTRTVLLELDGKLPENAVSSVTCGVVTVTIS